MFQELFAKGGLSLDRLRSFAEIARAGGIAKAAAGDPVKQSQYSRQVRELEEFFGVELTARRGRNVVLTPAGESLATLIREVLGALSDFLRTHRGDAAEIRVGAGESLIQWLVIPRIADLKTGLGDAILSMRNLRTDEIVRLVENAELDIGIVRADATTAQLGAVRIGVLRHMLFVSGKTETGKKLSWRSALARPWVGLEGEGQLMSAFHHAAEAAGLEPKESLLCSSMPAVALALRELDGVAVLPEIARTDDLTAISAPFLREFDREIVLVWSRRQASIRPVVDHARSVMSRCLTW